MTDIARRLHQRIMMMVGIGRLNVIDDTGDASRMQVSLGPGEIRDGLPFYGLFGFASRAPKGSGIVALFLGGNRSSGAVIGVNHPASRPKTLKDGETIQYDIQGQKVYLSTTGIQIVGSGSLPMTVSNVSEVQLQANVAITGTLTVSETITAMGDVVGANVSLQNHKTAGVQAGSEISGDPIPS